MVFCGSGGMATVPPVDGGTEAAAGGAALGGGVIWLVSGCLAVAGVVAGVVVVFFAFFDVVEGTALGVDVWAFFRHELRVDALFWLWQLVEDLVLGVGVGAAEGSSWANEGAANETAARAARPAIKRRMKITPGPLAEGDGTASI